MGLCRYPIETRVLKAPLIAAGIGITPRKANTSELDDVNLQVSPDFVIPAGRRHR